MKPLLVDKWRDYGFRSLQKDLMSGLIIGIIAIPLGMAFAIASGVEPEYGLYTTIIAGIAISLLGGSKFQIGGPTGAFIPVLLAVVLHYGYESLLIAGFMAGIILVAMGLLKLGGLVRFIPKPVTIGFTAGIAVVIFSGQIAGFLGLTGLRKHEWFVANMAEIGKHLSQTNGWSVLTASIGLAAALLAGKYVKFIPASLAGLLLSTLAAMLIFPDKVATIGSVYGAIPSGFPSIRFPEITLERVMELWKPAFVIALLGGVESLLSSVVADGMSGTKHNSNRELVGQGIANMAAPLLGGIPATGAIARTAANIRNGAQSRLSGVFHSVFVLLVLLLLAPYASHIPLASMAPILMLVAWNMSERKHFVRLLKKRSLESGVMAATFLLTVFTDLVTAVEVGLVLSAVIFVKRMSEQPVTAKIARNFTGGRRRLVEAIRRDERGCSQIAIMSLQGALFFGVAGKLENMLMEELRRKPAALILRMKNVTYIDATAEETLAAVIGFARRQGIAVLASGAQGQPRSVIRRAGPLDRDDMPESTGEAIACAQGRLERGTNNAVLV